MPKANAPAANAAPIAKSTGVDIANPRIAKAIKDMRPGGPVYSPVSDAGEETVTLNENCVLNQSSSDDKQFYLTLVTDDGSKRNVTIRLKPKQTASGKTQFVLRLYRADRYFEPGNGAAPINPGDEKVFAFLS